MTAQYFHTVDEILLLQGYVHVLNVHVHNVMVCTGLARIMITCVSMAMH